MAGRIRAPAVALGVAGAIVLALPATASAQNADERLLAACLELVGDDVGTLFPRLETVSASVAAEGFDTRGMPQVAACSDTLSLDEL